MLSFTLHYMAVFTLTTFCSIVQGSLLNALEEMINNSKDNNSICIYQYKQVVEGLKSQQTWALKMIDSDGSIPNGILDGNVIDLGSFDECLSVAYHGKNESLFGKYCLGVLNISATSNFDPLILEVINQYHNLNKSRPIEKSVCIPNGCTASDIRKMNSSIFNIDLHDTFCQTKEDYFKFDYIGVFVILVFSSIFALVIGSTLVDFYYTFIKQEQQVRNLKHFSLIRNFQTFFDITSDPYYLEPIQGIRFLSTIWLILNHQYSIDYVTIPRRNGNYVLNWFLYIMVVSASFSCDTFFLIGGFLVVYNYIKWNETEIHYRFYKFYWKRYLRLTPVLVTTILFYVGIFQHLGSGPLWPSLLNTYFINSCKENWWKALLYIQDFDPLSSTCVMQSWYLSVDMQFYIISPFLLSILGERSKFALTAFGIISICSMGFAFLAGWILKLNWNANSKNADNYYVYYYFAPQIRISSWLIGMCLAYIFVKGRPDLNQTTILILWTSSITVLLTCLFCGYNLYMGFTEDLENAFNMAILRPLWTLGVGWIIYACLTGCGGYVNSFLSLPIFQRLAKLTYCMYLTQFIVLFTKSAQLRTTENFTNYYEFTTYWYNLLWILVIALIFHLFVEAPFRNFSKTTVPTTRQAKMTEKSPLLV